MERIVGVGEHDASRSEVVISKHSRGMEARGVRGRAQPVTGGRSGLALVLAYERAAPPITVHAETVRLVQLGRGECPYVPSRRSVGQELSVAPESPRGELGGHAPLRQREVV